MATSGITHLEHFIIFIVPITQNTLIGSSRSFAKISVLSFQTIILGLRFSTIQ